MNRNPRSDSADSVTDVTVRGRRGELDEDSVVILGVRVSTLALREMADVIVRWACEPQPPSGPRYVCATSVHGLVEAERDPEFQTILNRASLVAPDGMPLVWVGRARGARSMSRVYGPALTLEVCRLSAGRGVRHFFYGGAPGVADLLAQRLAAEFPGLLVAGTYSPPFRPLTRGELADVGLRISDTSPDIVWVGLSTPKQERWIAAAREHLGAKVVLSVGAAFDFHTGRIRQAPRWMQHAGLEWLFRLIQEPRRLWRRYLFNNPTFLALVAREALSLRKEARPTSHPGKPRA